MFYDRKIKYFDYMEHGQRLRNGGFVKLEVRDSICNITLQISGLHAVPNNNYKIYLLSADKQEILCEIQLFQGKGSKVLHLQSNNLCAGISYGQMEVIQIPISSTRELRCHIVEKVEEKIAEGGVEVMKAAVLEVSVEKQETGPLKEIGPLKETEPSKEADSQKGTKARKTSDTRRAEVEEDSEIKRIPLLEDKWKQLAAIYPHITPFHDDREYLSIGPGDFVIMPHKYYKLVNNSFLLHGFYNYKHLILTRMERRGEIYYYIGVPGNFYEREKQVALMFGFESFECCEEPAGSGDFGYYMIRVEI